MAHFINLRQIVMGVRGVQSVANSMGGVVKGNSRTKNLGVASGGLLGSADSSGETELYRNATFRMTQLAAYGAGGVLLVFFLLQAELSLRFLVSVDSRDSSGHPTATKPADRRVRYITSGLYTLVGVACMGAVHMYAGRVLKRVSLRVAPTSAFASTPTTTSYSKAVLRQSPHQNTRSTASVVFETCALLGPSAYVVVDASKVSAPAPLYTGHGM